MIVFSIRFWDGEVETGLFVLSDFCSCCSCCRVGKTSGDGFALANDVLLPFLSPISRLIELIDTAERCRVGDEFSVSLRDEIFVDSDEFFETGIW